MDQELSVRLKADGSGLVGEVRAGTAELDRMEKSAAVLERRMQSLNSQQRAMQGAFKPWRPQADAEELRALDDELAVFMSKVSPTYNAVKQLDTGHDLLSRSLQAGLLSQKQYDEALGRMQKKYGPAAQGAEVLGHAHGGLSRQSREAARDLSFLATAAATGNANMALMSGTMLSTRLSGIGVAGMVAAMGIGAVAGGLALIIAEGERGNRTLAQLDVQLAATGRGGALTRAQLGALVDDLARLPGMTRDFAGAAASALVGVPAIAAPLFRNLTSLVNDYAAATGQKVPQAAQALAKAFENPAQGAKTLDQQLNVLTASQRLHIDTLTQQGRVVEAQQVLFQALEGRVKGLAERGLTPLQQATTEFGNAWDKLLQGMANSGAIVWATQKLADMLNVFNQLEGATQRAAQPARSGLAPGETAGGAAAGRAFNMPAKVPTPVRQIGWDVGFDAAADDAFAAAQAATQKLISDALNAGRAYEGTAGQMERLRNTAVQLREAMSKAAGDPVVYRQLREQLAGVNRQMKELSDTSALTKERAQTQFAIQKDALDRGRAYLDQNYKLELISFIEYTEAKKAIQLAAIDAEEARLRRELAIAQGVLGRAQPGAQAAGARAQVETVQARIGALSGQRGDVQRGYDVAWGERELDISKKQLQGQQELKTEQERIAAELATAHNQQAERFRQTDEEYRTSTRQAEIAAITDSRARTLAQFDFERSERQRRINEITTDLGQRKRLEDDLATWTVARQAQLNEELKPEWQKMTEAWGDSTRFMRDSVDAVAMSSARAGEELVVQWRRTGQLSGRALGDAFLDEWMRALYRATLGRQIAEVSAGMATGVLGFFGLGGAAKSSGSSDMGSAGAGEAAEAMATIAHGGWDVGAPSPATRAVPAAAFAGARRLHGGYGVPRAPWLAPGEFPAILERGEIVVPKRKAGRVRAMIAHGGGAVGGGGFASRAVPRALFFNAPRLHGGLGLDAPSPGSRGVVQGGSRSVTVNAPLNVSIDARNASPGTEAQIMSTLQRALPGLLYQHRRTIAGLLSSQERESGRRR